MVHCTAALLYSFKDISPYSYFADFTMMMYCRVVTSQNAEDKKNMINVHCRARLVTFGLPRPLYVSIYPHVRISRRLRQEEVMAWQG
jgi:hypothetical protein